MQTGCLRNLAGKIQYVYIERIRIGTLRRLLLARFGRFLSRSLSMVHRSPPSDKWQVLLPKYGNGRAGEKGTGFF